MVKLQRSAKVLTLSLSAAMLFGSGVLPANAIGLGDVLGGAKAVQSTAKSKNKDSAKTDEKANAKSDDPELKLSTWTGPKKRLGVMDMDVKVTSTQTMQPTTGGGLSSTTSVSIPPPADFGTGLSEMLTTSLIDSGRFVLLERKSLADIQAEQALAAGGSVDPASAAPAGKLLGAQALIRGAVTEYSYRSSSTGGSASILKGIGLAATSSEALVGLDIRIYDAATGQILDSVKAEGKAKSSAVAIDIDKDDWKVGGSSFKQSPLGAATREAINKAVILICKRMDILPWEGRVAEIDDGTPPTLYLNAGSQSGMKEGMQLEVVRPGRAIKDPDTATIIGRTKDTYLGVCEITQCLEKLSLMKPIDGQGFQIGDCVHLFGWKGPVDRAPQPSATPAPEGTAPAQEVAPAADAAPTATPAP